MRKTIKLEAFQQAFNDYADLMGARKTAAFNAGEDIHGIDPELYTAIVMEGAFAMLKAAQRLAGRNA
jgi:hypothetical protein